jgi:hypothetical protein
MLRYALDLLVALAALAIVVCVALTLASCSSPTGQPELEQRVVAATLEAWDRMGLPEPDEERCQTERFEARFADPAEFAHLCRPYTADQVNGCLVWKLVEHRAMSLYSIRYPLAVVDARDVPDEAVKGLLVHELAHALIHCTLRRSYLDSHDAGHTIPEVWGRGETVERYAREALGVP